MAAVWRWSMLAIGWSNGAVLARLPACACLAEDSAVPRSRRRRPRSASSSALADPDPACPCAAQVECSLRDNILTLNVDVAADDADLLVQVDIQLGGPETVQVGCPAPPLWATAVRMGCVAFLVVQIELKFP